MGNDLKLRRWQDSDCQIIYEWRSNPQVLRWCFDQRTFPYEYHQKWFAGFLGDVNRVGYILEDSGEPVAQIRFDPAEMPGCYRISLAVAPGQSGKGYGGSILHLACKDPEVRRRALLLVAETMSDNLPSQKIFVRNGFSRAGSGEYQGFAVICWLMPLIMSAQPLRLQLFAEPSWLEDIEHILSVTGLALLSDETARIKLFMGAAVSSDELYSSIILHLNIANGTVLDLAMRYPGELKLPIEFFNVQTAVAQIAASLLYRQIHG